MEKMVNAIDKWGPKERRFLAAALYVLILFIVFGTVFTKGRSLYPITYAGRSTDYLISNDDVLEHINSGGIYADQGASDWVEIPIMYAASQNVSRGEMPLWDIYNSMGMPIIDNNNGSTLAPFALLLYLSNSEMAWNIMYILRIFTIMFFTYLFLEELGIKFGAAFTGGVVFGLSGYVMLYLNIFFMHVDAFLPMLMWMTLRYWKTGKLRHWTGVTLVIAAMCLGGNPQNLITCCLLAYTFFAFYVFTSKDRNARVKIGAIAKYTGCFASGVLLTMGYWLSFLTLYANCYSYHGNAGLGVKSFQQLLGLIIPAGYFIPVIRAGWMPYMGILVILVILIHAEWGKGKNYYKEKQFFAAFIALFLLKIAGFPLINWIGKLPILNELSFTKYNSCMYFAVAVLTAMALNDMGLSTSKFRKWIQCFFLGALAIGVNIAFLAKLSETNQLLNSYMGVMSMVLIIAVIIAVVCTLMTDKKYVLIFTEALICIELISYPLHHRDLFIPRGVVFDPPEFVTELKKQQENEYDRVFCVDKLLMGNLSGIYQICSVGGISPTPEIHYWNFMNELILDHNIDIQMVTTQSSAYYPPCKKYLDMIGTKFFMADDERRIDDPSLVPVYEKGRLIIYKNEDSFEKAYTVHDVIQVNSEEEALAAMKNDELDFSCSAVVEGDISYLPVKAADGQTDIVTIDTYKANEVTLSCYMAADGLLILNDLYYPGWCVYVNGEKQEIVRTNDVVRGVCLRQGENAVRFVYRPKAFWTGCGISIAFVSIFITGMIILKKETSKCKRK